jgi:hypothetical protein
VLRLVLDATLVVQDQVGCLPDPTINHHRCDTPSPPVSRLPTPLLSFSLNLGSRPCRTDAPWVVRAHGELVLVGYPPVSPRRPRHAAGPAHARAHHTKHTLWPRELMPSAILMVMGCWQAALCVVVLGRMWLSAQWPGNSNKFLSIFFSV